MWLRLVRRLRSHGLLVHRSESSDGIQIYKLESGNVMERRLRSALIATAWLSPVHSVHALMHAHAPWTIPPIATRTMSKARWPRRARRFYRPRATTVPRAPSVANNAMRSLASRLRRRRRG